MIYLLIAGAFLGMTLFLISKNIVIQILSIKLLVDSSLLAFYNVTKAGDELKSLSWLFMAMSFVAIFLMMIAALNKAVHRGNE